MLMTAADVSAIAKPWELQHETAKMVADEFFDQGDMEKLQLNITPMVWKLLQFRLTLMGVLAPGSGHARPSARPPINMSGILLAHMSAKSPSIISPKPSDNFI